MKSTTFVQASRKRPAIADTTTGHQKDMRFSAPRGAVSLKQYILKLTAMARRLRLSWVVFDSAEEQYTLLCVLLGNIISDNDKVVFINFFAVV